MTKIVAERYQVPEIEPLASFRGIVEQVSPMCGRKQNFGFVYHQQGRPQDSRQTNQLVIPEWQRTESHLFRQDIDAYLFRVAVGYGAEPCLDTRITGIETDPEKGVRLRSDRGKEFLAEYLVDSSGFRSPVAEAFGLREVPTRARLHSRTLFTHMVGVTAFDNASAAKTHDQPSPWHHGTLHHVFDGGWLWVIPFDNHKGSLNGLCSVGLTLDERAFPKSGLPPRQEFDAFLRRFPEIAEQFATAKAVRPWVGTGRLQYSVTRAVGERYCLTSHAAGFIDALYSRGLTNTLEVVNALAWRLIEASQDGDWSTERFAYIDGVQQGLFDVHDDLAYSSFVGFRHYELWNAVTRVWQSTSILPTMVLMKALRTFLETRDSQVFRDLEKTDTPGLPAPIGEDIAALLAFTRETCQEVESGSIAPGEAAERLFARIERADFLPAPFQLGDPDNRHLEATPEMLQRVGEWSKTEAPERIRPVFV